MSFFSTKAFGSISSTSGWNVEEGLSRTELSTKTVHKVHTATGQSDFLEFGFSSSNVATFIIEILP
jgi:hypothetical protein